MSQKLDLAYSEIIGQGKLLGETLEGILNRAQEEQHRHPASEKYPTEYSTKCSRI